MKNSIYLYLFTVLFVIVLLPLSVAASTSAETIEEPYIGFSKKVRSEMKPGEKQTLRVKGYGTEETGFVFKSSNKKIAKVSAKGRVTAIAPGKVTITVYDSEHRASCSTRITVLEPTVADRLLSVTEDIPNKSYSKKNYCKTVDEVQEKIIDIYSSGYYPVVLVDDLSIIPEETYFTDTYPAIMSFQYVSCKKYKNGYAVKAKIQREVSMFADEFLIDCAIETNETSRLSEDELKTYTRVIELADTLKAETEEQTVKNMHDYLVLKHAYPMSFRDRNELHRLAYALDNVYCVCDGYAKSFYFIGKAAGLEVKLVHGKVYTETAGWQDHSWNKVQIGGKWYNLDVTLDDSCPDVPGEIKYTYFCVSDDAIADSHIWD